jgi:hypothetical protein
MPEQLTPDQYRVDDEAAEHCPYCGRPLATEHLRTLHVGERHADAMTDAEEEAYEAAHDEESEDLFIFHIKVMAIITLVTFVFIYTYTFVWL